MDKNKTSVERFIEGAIKGGWCGYAGNVARGELPLEEAVKAMRRELRDTEILLDPLAWQTYGKTAGWPPNHTAYKGWKNKWHDFIDLLAEGKSLEQALQEII